MPTLRSAKRKVIFELDAPEAQKVELAGDFTDWDKKPVGMSKKKGGSWRASVRLDPGTYQYRFLVDGQWFDDPQCIVRVPNPFGAENCVRMVE